MARIDLINGPNLNMLGQREADIYGGASLQDIEDMTRAAATKHGLRIECYQSNHEGELIDHIHRLHGKTGGVIINAGGLTHTSVALADALRILDVPIVELHISNIYARESFRHTSYLSAVAKAVMCGFGTQGYTLAVEGLVSLRAAVK
ncbi:MAG: type II 3-dehydroquinate dehydratase [Rickettsiales bacterium]|nr:type II 3-dehydroquinate dehydratase [Rickettsiales bacterium]|tara:strand:- start:539 stop:982 length:444 start_codon:yes stop_codon:yes gene_type:complete